MANCVYCGAVGQHQSHRFLSTGRRIQYFHQFSREPRSPFANPNCDVSRTEKSASTGRGVGSFSADIAPLAEGQFFIMTSTTNMIAIVPSGQPPVTDGQVVSEREILFHLQNDVHHFCIFLTGSTPFPMGHGGSVYLLHDTGGTFTFLGAISNEKPSAIFKVNKSVPPTPPSPSSSGPGPLFNSLSQGQTSTAIVAVDQTLRIGVVIESFEDIQLKVAQIEQMKQQRAHNYTAFAKWTCEGLYDHLSGWILTFDTLAKMSAQEVLQEKLVPLGAISQWFDNFQRRLAQNPEFWRKA